MATSKAALPASVRSRRAGTASTTARAARMRARNPSRSSSAAVACSSASRASSITSGSGAAAGEQAAGEEGGHPRRAQACAEGLAHEQCSTWNRGDAGAHDRASFHAMAASSEHEIIEVSGHEVRVSNPGKLYFPAVGVTKLDLVSYYVECEQAVRAGPERAPHGDEAVGRRRRGQAVLPEAGPRQRARRGCETATVTFPSGRHARELVPNDAAHLVWGVNLGVIDWNPWPVRRADLDSPDELRVDLDPGPGVTFDEVRQVALSVREVLEEHDLRGFPKTSGSRGIHIYVRLVPEQGFEEVRRAALALAREVERRMPGRATSRWWKEEREGVFIDYNQNARDRTVASAYSVRAVADARVSCPLEWEEVAAVEPDQLTLRTVPARLAERGDPSAAIDERPGSLDGLLELAARDEREGLGDAPWPPHFRKQKGEPKRVQPSRAKAGRAAAKPKGEAGSR